MRIDLMTKEVIGKHIDKMIQDLRESISRKRPTDDVEKDNIITWWNRGQVFALEQLAKHIMEDNDNDD